MKFRVGLGLLASVLSFATAYQTRSDRVRLASIKSLTLHSDVNTAARRTCAVPQLTCVGKTCQLYQPESVYCVNLGDDGVGGVSWKCEADLPESLRFGKVEVVCEGYDGPGDPYVLKGSCALEYRLVQLNDKLRGASSSYDSYLPSKSTLDKSLNLAFNLLFIAVLFWILYTLFRSTRTPRTPGASNQRPRPWFDAFGGSGWGGGNGPDETPPPPPYTKYASGDPQQQQQGWRPGFWTGLGLGGLAAAAMRQRQERQAWDWETRIRAREAHAPRGWRSGSAWGGGGGNAARFGGSGFASGSGSGSGSGSAGLGEMRTSSGIGGSRTR